MNARDEGRRIAARENAAAIVNPYLDGVRLQDADWAIEFQAGVDEVLAHRAKGLDPEGHQPPRPHLCIGDVTKVCNCCSRCEDKCRAEAAPLVPLVSLARAERGQWILARIAHALERLAAGTTGDAQAECNNCGCLVVSVKSTHCPVCGEHR